MAVYERGVGPHVAERVRPAPGPEAERYAALAADPASGWRCAEPDPAPEPVEPKHPTKSASKADWKAYAVAQGMAEEDAEKATRDELAAQYTEGGGPGGSDD
ncbi:hypothetical protein [Streptomyces albipurpureus]|uniref:Uncharacterized protein n=1 Tax=Streptomyces albipurpureus TaxID=2897419 RepID=A0ABT0V1G8_9ACTN|nr:hypothetical protein [Streptomyces sp. CWNU-1]MCM2394356.1 hypothetical protein [Streptomyces sp. CWNU-1]